MGTDIMAIAQVKLDGQWRLNPMKVFPTCGYHRKFFNEKDADFTKDLTEHPLEQRFYDWYSIIIDRNDHRFTPIAVPRGIPAVGFDTSQEELHCFSTTRNNSWLHINDFDNFDWNQIFIRQGIVKLEEYKKLRGTADSPSFYSEQTGGQGVNVLSMDEANSFLEGRLEVEDGKHIYVRYEWPVTYAEWFKPAIDSWFTPLRNLTEIFEDARIVFGFY